MALRLKLRQGERLLVNGAVLEMGPRHGEIIIHNMANCLRGHELLQEEEATTPVRRVHFQIQMMIVDPENGDTYRERFEELLGQLEQALTNREMLERLAEVRAEVRDGRPYRGLALLRAVRRYEDVLLASPRPAPAGVAV